MQRRDNNIFSRLWVVALAVLLLPFMAVAQTSSVNAYSPYSMYGPGELLTPGSAQMRSMGGVGIGLRSQGQPNVQNPAASALLCSCGIIFGPLAHTPRDGWQCPQNNCNYYYSSASWLRVCAQ